MSNRRLLLSLNNENWRRAYGISFNAKEFGVASFLWHTYATDIDPISALSYIKKEEIQFKFIVNDGNLGLYKYFEYSSVNDNTDSDTELRYIFNDDGVVSSTQVTSGYNRKEYEKLYKEDLIIGRRRESDKYRVLAYSLYSGNMSHHDVTVNFKIPIIYDPESEINYIPYYQHGSEDPYENKVYYFPEGNTETNASFIFYGRGTILDTETGYV